MATLRSIVEDLNLELEKAVAKGTYDGFDITLIQNIDVMGQQPAFKNLFITFDEITQQKATSFVEYVKEVSSNLPISDFKFASTYMVFKLDESTKGLETTDLKELLDLLLEKARSLMIEPSSKCIYCGLETKETIVLNKVERKAHKRCHDQELERKEEEKKNVGYFAPILGALIGSAIGAIPFLVVFFFFNSIAYLMILIAPATFFGYKTLGGVFTPKAKYIVASFTFLSAAITYAIEILLSAYVFEVTAMQLISDYADYYIISAIVVVLATGWSFRMCANREEE